MVDQNTGDLGGGPAPPSPAPSPSPAPPERRPAALNPRAQAPRSWQDDLRPDGQRRLADEARTPEPPDVAAPRADGAKHRIGDLELTETQARDLLAREAAEKSRALTRPQRPEDYKFGLSPNFKPPQGLEFKLNEADPIVAQYRQFALESGLDQAQFTKGLDMVAALRVGEAQTFETAKTAELAKLGATAGNRIYEVTNWLTAMAGDKALAMVKVLEMAPVAGTVEALETIMQKFVTQGGPAFSANGRTNTDANGKIPGYDKMSFEQRRFAQDQQNRRGGR